MLLTVLSFLAFAAVIAYFAMRKKETKLKEYEIPTNEPEIKHVIAEVEPVVFETEPEPIKVVTEEKPKKTATKKPTVKKTKATKNGK